MIERLKRCETLDEIVVAIPDTSGNGPIYDVLLSLMEDERVSLFPFLGDENDVLGRVLAAAHFATLDMEDREGPVIVELTADCPLIDPKLVDQVVKQYFYSKKALRLDMYTTTRDALPYPKPYYPRGMDIRVFSREVLEDLDKLTVDDPVSREHVSLYAWEHRNRFWVANYHAPRELCDDIRLTVDYPEDLELVRTIFEEFLPHKPDFGLGDILELLEYRPELRQINAHVEQRAVR